MLQAPFLLPLDYTMVAFSGILIRTSVTIVTNEEIEYAGYTSHGA